MTPSLVKPAGMNTIDTYLGCGCYQAIHFLLLQFINFVNAFNMAGMMVFGKVEPKWTCLDWNYDNSTTNLTKSQFFTCDRLNNFTCQNMTLTSDFNSVAMEFGLVCSGVKTIFLSMSIQMIGVLVASPLFGQLSDWYGRKWILFSATLAEIVFGTASAWSPNMTVFIAFRFFIGIFAGGSLVTSQIYFVEFLTGKHRFWVNAASTWSVSYALFAIFAYLTADWRKFTLIGNLGALPGLVILCFMKESPRWLLQRGKIVEAENSLRFISRVNRSKHDFTKSEGLLEAIGRKESLNATVKRVHYSFWDLLKTKELRTNTLVLCFCYFTCASISYGIIYDSSTLVGNRYINFFLFAALRYLASMLTIIVDSCFKRCGRKVIFCTSLGIICISCTAIGVLTYFGQSKTVTVSALAIFSGVMTSPIWNSLSMSASEIFPTPIRNVGTGFAAVFNRLGLVISPQILYMAYFWPPSKYIIFASLAAVAVVLNFIIIPETKGKPLPEKMPTVTEKLLLPVAI
jgi:OCT family organic cation transporter-like MFS transporter 4/5